MNNLQLVREFHEKMGLAVDQPFSFDLLKLRFDLIREEFEEVEEEIFDIKWYAPDEKEVWQKRPEDVNRPQLTKELADLLYVVYGTAVTFNLPLQEVFEEVHKSNMSKLGDDGRPIYREDGKVMKGPNYKPANVEQFFNA